MVNKIVPLKERYIFLYVSFTLWFSHFIYLPILSPYMETLGAPYSFIGIVLGSYGLMQFVCRMPIGFFSDMKKRRKPFLIGGMVVSASSCLLFALSEQLHWILLARATAGVAASTWVVFSVLYASYFEDRHLPRAMGNISFVVVLAQLLGMAGSGILSDLFGFRATYWVGFLFSISGIIMAFQIQEAKQSSQRPIAIRDFGAVLRNPHILKVAVLSILAHGIIFSTMFGFIPNFALSIGLNAKDISILVFAFMIPHALSTLLLGKVIVPKLGTWRSLGVAFFVTALFVLYIPFLSSLLGLMANLAVTGFALGVIFPLLLGMAIEKVEPSKRATAMGVYQALYAIGMFGGPYAAGILISIFHMAAGFYFVSALGFLASLLVVVWSAGDAASRLKRRELSS